MFKNINNTNPLDFSGTLLAKVVDNNDPLKKQRVKVTIPNVLEGAVSLLPWCLPNLPTGLGMGTSVQVCVPEVGSIIKVYLTNGELSYLEAYGSCPINETSLPVELATNYPKRRGEKDSAATVHYIDTTAGEEEWHIKVAGGASISIKKGNVQINLGTEGGTISGGPLTVDSEVTFAKTATFQSASTFQSSATFQSSINNAMGVDLAAHTHAYTDDGSPSVTAIPS